MKMRGVAFDLEGTVVDVEHIHHQSHLEAAAEAGVQLRLEEAISLLPHFIGGPDETVAHEIAGLRVGVSPALILACKRLCYERLLSRTADIRPRVGFLRVFDELKDRGVPMAIGSLTATAQARVLLGRSGLDQLFPPECVVLREDVNNLKPAPDVFLETARRMGINPCAQLVFEDSPNGVCAAIAAGSRAVGMPVLHH